jgi:hypothetical protein
MSDITKGLYDRLSADATLQGLLSTFDGGAAVFSTHPIPDDATLPYVTITGLAETPFESKPLYPGGVVLGDVTTGRDVSYDIGCYTDDTGSAVAVEAIKERVRALLHRHILTIANFTTIVADVSGTVQADEDGVFGRIVTIRLIVEEV